MSDWGILGLLVMAKMPQTCVLKEIIHKFDDKLTAKLAKRLEEDDYPNPFEGLDDWHLLRALAIHRPELTLDYHHLIDQEPFDED